MSFPVRPSREEALVATAFVWADRSTCSRLAVGAVAHREGRILVQGYNGAPAGMPHCDHECTCTDDYPYDLTSSDQVTSTVHHIGCPTPEPCTIAQHAEMNGIAWAAREGVKLDKADWVITHQPCENCARSLINSGAASVLYVHPYRLQAGVELLRLAGIRVEQYLDWEEPQVVELGGDEA